MIPRPFDNNVIARIEQIANLGTCERDLDDGSWTGSDNFIKIFGLPEKPRYTQEEFQFLVHSDEVDGVMAYYRQTLDSQKNFNYEYRCICPDGKIIHVLSRRKISRDEKDVPVKILDFKQDILHVKK
ncbi:MAG: PAS domain-containing protein [Balneolaceae bacterium]|nr:PAS domain-containing protein [Balneolaceae bacterium]